MKIGLIFTSILRYLDLFDMQNLFDNLSGIPDFPKSHKQYDVCGGVIYISNKSKYLETEMRYATVVKTNLSKNL